MLISCKRTSRASPLGGFTLVEVVISILLVAVTLVAALNTVGGVFRNYAIARERRRIEHRRGRLSQLRDRPGTSTRLRLGRNVDG